MDTPSTSDNPVASRQKQRWALGGLIAATTASVVLSLSAWAGGEDGFASPASGAMAGHAMHHHPGGFDAMPFGGHQLQRLLDEAKATDAQRTQIKQIADKAQADLQALHEEGRGLHEQGLKIWAAPKIDAAAAEQLRQRMQAHHDKVSKRLLQAMLDVGNVLTPEQRATVADKLRKHHEDMGRRFEQRHGEHRRPHEPGASATPGAQ